jgi:uncharacterized protein (TIGR03437 family)
VQDTRASVLWTASTAGDGKVVVGSPDGKNFTVQATMRAFAPAVTKLSSIFYQYQANLTGLQAGTQYAYRITLNGATLTAGPGFFRTAAPGSFSFLAFGDSGENTPEQRALIPLMGSEPDISFLMHTGDVAYPEASYAELETDYFSLNAPLFERLPVFPTPGNHDYLVDSAVPFLASHSLPASGADPADVGRYYSFDWGNAHFASFDSNLLPTDAADRMLAWLENDLASTRQFWKIVFVHHAPYPTGHHLGDPICGAVHARVNPIAERYGVQLVLAGHEHGYERTMPLSADGQMPPGLGTIYVITGGGGANLHDVNCGGATEVALEMFHYLRVDVDGGKLTIRATGVDGGEIERFVLRPRPVLRDRAVVSIGDSSEALAPGSLVSILGQNLAVEPQAAFGTPLPLQLGGVRVQLDGKDIPLLYVSPGQINAQIPYEAQASGALEIFTDNGSARTNISILQAAPSILVVTAGDAPATADNAPAAGDPVVVYVTGLGRRQALAQVDIRLGNLRIEPSFAGPAPGFAGVHQVNFTVPASVSAGTYPLTVATPGASSRPAPLAVR